MPDELTSPPENVAILERLLSYPQETVYHSTSFSLLSRVQSVNPVRRKSVEPNASKIPPSDLR